MLQKVGRFLASRVQGTKGKQKYDKYMKENPWARTALGAGDLALAFYGPGMAGKLLQKAGGMGKLAGTGIGQAATRAGNFLAGTPAVQYRGPGTVGRGATKGVMGRIGQNLMGSVTQPGIARQAGGALARGATAAGRFVAQNPSVVGAALQAVPALSQQSAMAEQTRQMNQLSMEEMKRRQAQRDQMMELLRPLFLQLQQGG
jgi:hypothetical protein